MRFVVLLMCCTCAAQTADKKFFASMLPGATVTMLDSYTTGKIRSNWDNGWGKNCSYEGESPWLYGEHPGYARSFAVGAGQIALAGTLSYILKRHHKRYWMAPQLALLISIPDVIHNFKTC